MRGSSSEATLELELSYFLLLMQISAGCFQEVAADAFRYLGETPATASGPSCACFPPTLSQYKMDGGTFKGVTSHLTGVRS